MLKLPDGERVARPALLSALVLLACCAGPNAQQEPVSAEEQIATASVARAQAAEPAPRPAAEPTKTEPAFPDRCADDNAKGVCGVPDDFTHEVCGGRPKPDVALVLFAKGSPWTRGYVKHNTEAWYTGSRSSKSALKSQEEVVVLRHPDAHGGIIVNGGGGPFDVMRLDGACATLSGDEVSLKHLEAPKHPLVPWRQLDPRVRQALLADQSVSEASTAYDGDCRDSASPACGKAGTKLTAAIVSFIARGGKVPTLVTWR
jgi:hypothetical protein